MTMPEAIVQFKDFKMISISLGSSNNGPGPWEVESLRDHDRVSVEYLRGVWGPPGGPRRAMPNPAVNETDEDRSRFTERSSAVDEAAIA
eukprot:scaffold1283_cov364-Pavlova_lutheri.AAC.1